MAMGAANFSESAASASSDADQIDSWIGDMVGDEADASDSVRPFDHEPDEDETPENPSAQQGGGIDQNSTPAAESGQKPDDTAQNAEGHSEAGSAPAGDTAAEQPGPQNANGHPDVPDKFKGSVRELASAYKSSESKIGQQAARIRDLETQLSQARQHVSETQGLDALPQQQRDFYEARAEKLGVTPEFLLELDQRDARANQEQAVRQEASAKTAAYGRFIDSINGMEADQKAFVEKGLDELFPAEDSASAFYEIRDKMNPQTFDRILSVFTRALTAEHRVSKLEAERRVRDQQVRNETRTEMQQNATQKQAASSGSKGSAVSSAPSTPKGSGSIGVGDIVDWDRNRRSIFSPN